MYLFLPDVISLACGPVLIPVLNEYEYESEGEGDDERNKDEHNRGSECENGLRA